jgi:hypothetical protein
MSLVHAPSTHHCIDSRARFHSCWRPPHVIIERDCLMII